jgi:hypothetical protein
VLFTNHQFDALNACSGQAFHFPPPPLRLIPYHPPCLALTEPKDESISSNGKGGQKVIGDW